MFIARYFKILAFIGVATFAPCALAQSNGSVVLLPEQLFIAQNANNTFQCGFIREKWVPGKLISGSQVRFQAFNKKRKLLREKLKTTTKKRERQQLKAKIRSLRELLKKGWEACADGPPPPPPPPPPTDSPSPDPECGVPDGLCPAGCSYPSDPDCDHCGDGVKQANEQCDDGNTNNSDGCNSNCQVETNWNCIGQPSLCILQPNICGNQTINSGEQCDGPIPSGIDCTDFGYLDGGVSCTANCLYNFSQCQGAPAQPGTIFVDALLSVNSCSGNSYSIANHNCQGSDGRAYKTIRGAVVVANAGDTILIRAGIYPERVELKGSYRKGLPGYPITLQAENWYHGAAHDKALTVVISGERPVPPIAASGIEITAENQYIVLRGLIMERAGKNLVIGNSHHITVEDCIMRDAKGDGISVFHDTGSQHDIVIKRSIFHHNGNAGLEFRQRTNNSLVEDCDASFNGWDQLENAEGFEVNSGPSHTEAEKSNIIFRRLLAYRNFSSSIGFSDNMNSVVEDSFAWGTTTYDDPDPNGGDSDGRNLIFGNGGGGGKHIMRRTVGFNSPLAGLMITGSHYATVYNVTLFDNGFNDDDTPAPGEKCGMSVGSNDLEGIMRNINTFDNSTTEPGDQYPQVRDFRVDSVIGFDSDYHLIKDGGQLDQPGWNGPHGSHTLDGDPQIKNKALAQSLASDYENGVIDRETFITQFSNALRPADTNSPLVDSGGFLVFATTSGTGTVIPVDRNPKRFFRIAIPSLNVEGDLIQIDDQDGNPTTKIIARIVSMTDNSITIDRSINFNINTGIATPFEGNAPDIGAFEYIPNL